MFSDNGVSIATECEQTDTTKFEFLPRIGFCIKLDKDFNKLKYNAYGDDETYCDMYEYAIKGEYESEVKEQYKHYVKPQECGSHYLPDYAEVCDGTYLCADCFMSGLGTNACGELPHEKYRTPKKGVGKITFIFDSSKL